MCIDAIRCLDRGLQIHVLWSSHSNLHRVTGIFVNLYSNPSSHSVIGRLFSKMFSNLNQMDLVREMTVPMLLVSTYAGLGGISFGIDNNFWSGFLGMSQFKKDFGVWDDTSGEWIIPSTWQSIATGTPTAGMAVGCLISGFVGQRLGRIRSFLLAAVIAIVGILIQATSFHAFWQLMAGRIINSISMGIICK